MWIRNRIIFNEVILNSLDLVNTKRIKRKWIIDKNSKLVVHLTFNLRLNVLKMFKFFWSMYELMIFSGKFENIFHRHWWSEKPSFLIFLFSRQQIFRDESKVSSKHSIYFFVWKFFLIPSRTFDIIFYLHLWNVLMLKTCIQIYIKKKFHAYSTY